MNLMPLWCNERNRVLFLLQLLETHLRQAHDENTLSSLIIQSIYIIGSGRKQPSVFYNKLRLNISQCLQENNCVGVSF